MVDVYNLLCDTQGYAATSMHDVRRLPLHELELLVRTIGHDNLSSLGRYGVAECLHLLHGLDVRGAEEQDVYQRAAHYLDSEWPLFERYVLQEREDAALRVAARTSERIHWLLFGDLHCWVDNVEQWNARCPDAAFSLATLTPPAICPAAPTALAAQ